MSRPPPSSSTSSSFDGPGARTILGREHPGHPPSMMAPSSPPASPSQYPHPNQRHLPPPHPHQQHAYAPYQQHPTAAVPPPLATGSPAASSPLVIKRVGGKANVSSACGPCKRAHLACDVARPCKRCVNMGKEDQCEDVPHKKRGRPKVNKTPSGDPYPRPVRPPGVEESKWKGPATYDSPYAVSASTATASPPPVPLGSLTAARLPSPSRPEPSYSAPVPLASASTGPQPDLFVLFCSTEFKILRVTPACHPLTGYHPHEFANLNLLDWLHPQDRHLVEMDRSRLLAVPYLSGALQTSREVHSGIMAASERELMSPAVGMREPYPNQNVRILRSDNSFATFNIRLHLGGGLGGSLWQPETLGKIYLVVSCLLIDREAGRPATAAPAAPAGAPSALPSFSAIAAAADAPPREAYSPYAGAHPALVSRASSTPQPAGYYRPPTAGSSYPRRSPSPTVYTTGRPHPSPSASYPPPTGYYPPGQPHSYERDERDWRAQQSPQAEYRRWEP